MDIFVNIGMEDGDIRHVRAFLQEASAEADLRSWLKAQELHTEKEREYASDWGTGIATWTVHLDS